MNDFERFVRDALGDRVAGPPPAPADPAGAALRRAGAIRRLRTGTTVVVGAVAAALAVIAGTVTIHSGGPSAPPAERASPRVATFTAVDYVLDGVLHSRSGRYPVGDGAVVRVPGGWVYDDGRGALHRLGRDGDDTVLTTSADSWVVSDDGGRVAWVSGHRLSVADRDRDRLVDRRSTPLPADGRDIVPVTWVGNRVVLRTEASCCGGTDVGDSGRSRYDTWDPADGDFVPRWKDGIAAVWGVAADGRTLIGAVPAAPDTDEVCVAALDPHDGMRVLRRACPAVPMPLGSVSPGGRWLAVEGDAVEVFALETVFTRRVPVPLTTLTGTGSGAPPTWTDARTLLLAWGDGGGQAWTPATGTVRWYPLPPYARVVR